MKRIPVIDITDLYHPHQDVGDNFDLLTAFGLPEVDLRAVILDITEEYLRPSCIHPVFGYCGGGPRTPGYLPVLQCNYLFDRNVPFAPTPTVRLSAPDDPLTDAETPFWNGVTLLLDTLRQSPEPVHILCFSSARAIAAAWNREPELMLRKVAMIHLSAGADGSYLEWNVLLDTHAFVQLLRSPLPVSIYPCATESGPFHMGVHNSYWVARDLGFVAEMEPRLRRYLAFAFGRQNSTDFLRALDADLLPEPVWYQQKDHNVWETAVWMRLAGRRLLRRPEGCAFLPGDAAGEPVFEETLIPVSLDVSDSGLFTWQRLPRGRESRKYLYERTLPDGLCGDLTHALGHLYRDFRPAK